ncbi:4-hydroxy-tetrahydrodipicolinate synthase [Starkeya nomas]|uniref:4-hydroxy-tetrahydrodipicolinate synthase n=1 Tax=Starkeya nomas TaxID=2666134 RepID=A0A5S9P136_9HYPH|nr:dihydrodipicolinate synthase family protein [Starkeya nomas]CAA0096969.1 4-hydroxy-tetrahydrodipicolinate synthase [Starkeya nomas]
MLSGTLIPLVTPFLAGMIDEDAFAHHVETLLAAGVSGFVTGAIAGEGLTLTPREKERLIRVAVEATGRRVPVIAATGTNATEATILATRAARDAGASAALLVTPYYNKPSQEGMYRHFKAVAEAVDLPLILHNTPQRTQVTLAPETLDRLGQLPSIFALLDESDDLCRQRAVAEVCAERLWRIAPGSLAAFLPGLRPPRACMSLAANIAPHLCVRLWEHRLAGRGKDVAALAAALDTLQHALDLEPEPVGAKYAISLLTPTFSPAPRLPLTAATPAAASAIRVALAALAGTHERALHPV